MKPDSVDAGRRHARVAMAMVLCFAINGVAWAQRPDIPAAEPDRRPDGGRSVVDGDTTAPAGKPAAAPSIKPVNPASLPVSDAVAKRLPVAEDASIKDAIAAELASTDKQPRLGLPLSEFRAEKFERFAQQFNEAKVPDCLHGDALKRQAPVLLFVRFEGLYAVPFVVLAKLRGKCL